jgi:nucleoside-diphosphate-sugar epimerase
MRIVVTGGAGFIGYNLIHKLFEQKHHVIAFDDLSAGEPSRRRDKLLNKLAKETYKDQNAGYRDLVLNHDIETPNLLNSTLKMTEQFDAIVHLAAPISVPQSYDQPRAYIDQIVDGTTEVLEVARQRKIKKVIFASSAAVYGDVEKRPTRECDLDHMIPTSPYGVVKRAAEDMARTYAKAHDLETVIFRFFNVYGPEQDPTNQYAGVVGKFLEAVRQGKSPTILGAGTQTRDFVYVDDVADAISAALVTPLAPGSTYNIASGRATSINDLAKESIAVNGKKSLQPKYEDARPGEIEHSLADITAARKALAWEPKTSLKEGLAKTYAWLKSSGSAP